MKGSCGIPALDPGELGFNMAPVPGIPGNIGSGKGICHPHLVWSKCDFRPTAMWLTLIYPLKWFHRPLSCINHLLINIWGLVPKLGELSHRLVKQQHDKESYLIDNVPDTTITIPGYALSHQQDSPNRC
eukprot:g37822.t1